MAQVLSVVEGSRAAGLDFNEQLDDLTFGPNGLRRVKSNHHQRWDARTRQRYEPLDKPLLRIPFRKSMLNMGKPQFVVSQMKFPRIFGLIYLIISTYQSIV